jgi:CspA family cold shock protein
VEGLKPGQRVEFGMAEGRRGPQALSVRLVDTPPSVVEAARRPAEDLHSLIEDMIRLLETKVQPDLRRGRYPDRRAAKLAAEVVRAVARDLDG